MIFSSLLDSILKSTDITLPTKVCLVKAMVFPIVMYGCESQTIKKAERRRIDAFELWCWRRLLRVPWTARRSNQCILKEISPECSLIGLMLTLKPQYFGHLMQRADLFEKTLMLGKTESRRRRGWQRMRWFDGIIYWTKPILDIGLGGLQKLVTVREAWRAVVHGVTTSWTRLRDWPELILLRPSCWLYMTEQVWFCWKGGKTHSSCKFPYYLPWKVKMLVAQLSPTLCNPMDCSLLGSSVHGILQARLLRCVAVHFSGGILTTWRLIPGLLNCRQSSYCLRHKGSELCRRPI